MLSFLRAPHPKLTQNAHNNPVLYQSDKSQIQFHPPSERANHFIMTNVVPPTPISSKSGQDDEASILQPPPHYHIYQSEKFLVRSGTGQFFIGLSASPTATVSSTSDESKKPIRVSRRRPHWFRNASTTEPLEVEIQLDPEDFQTSQKFFRNFFGYLNDCRLAGTQPSPFQLFVFLHDADTPLAIILPGSTALVGILAVILGQNDAERLVENVSFWISWVVLVAVAWVGRVMLGYRTGYDEYYVEKGSKGE